MKLFKEEFSIANINYKIVSNFDVHSLLFDPQPYNLHVNYLIQDKVPRRNAFTISILRNSKRLNVTTLSRELKISGNISPMFSEKYNQQFGLFGNKGLIHRFILHTLEYSGRASVLHAAAVIHPLKGSLYIAVGSSGSGKSVFISNALKIGWKLIATEQVIINTQGRIFQGNQYDNVSPKAVNFIRKKLKEAIVLKTQVLNEPIGSKVFVNLSKYTTDRIYTQLKSGNFTIIVLNFGNQSHKAGSKIVDEDFILRVIQQAASEKISSPIIFGDTIFDLNLDGDAKNRTTLINFLLRKAKDKVILGGDYSDFEKWLKCEYENC